MGKFFHTFKPTKPIACKKCNGYDLIFGVKKLKNKRLRIAFWIIVALASLFIPPLVIYFIKNGFNITSARDWISLSISLALICIGLFVKIKQIRYEKNFHYCLTCNECGNFWEINPKRITQKFY